MTVECQVSNELDRSFLTELARSPPLGDTKRRLFDSERKNDHLGCVFVFDESKVELIAGQMVSFGVLVVSWATSYSTAKLINLELAIVTLY